MSGFICFWFCCFEPFFFLFFFSSFFRQGDFIKYTRQTQRFGRVTLSSVKDKHSSLAGWLYQAYKTNRKAERQITRVTSSFWRRVLRTSTWWVSFVFDFAISNRFVHLEKNNHAQNVLLSCACMNFKRSVFFHYFLYLYNLKQTGASACLRPTKGDNGARKTSHEHSNKGLNRPP